MRVTNKVNEMALITNPCAEKNFNSGANPCSFEPGKIKGLIFHDKAMNWEATDNVGQRMDELEGLIFLAHNDRPNRIYPIGGIVQYEGSGGEAQTSQVGYGATRVMGYSEKQMTFTLDERSQNLIASIVKANNLENYAVMFVDDENRVYGFEGGTFDCPIEGISLGGVSLGGQEWETQDSPASLTLTLYINDYADFLAKLRMVQVDYDIANDVKNAGLAWVTPEFANGQLKIKMTYGGENITKIFWDFLTASGEANALTKFKAAFPSATAATAVSYNANGNFISVTGSTVVGNMAAPSALHEAGIDGFEQWVN